MSKKVTDDLSVFSREISAFAEVRVSSDIFHNEIIRILPDRKILPDCLTGTLTELTMFPDLGT